MIFIIAVCLLTHLPAYSMEQSPSWEVNWFSVSQEIPWILWNPKVNPVHVPSPHPHPTLWRSILILSSHPHPGLPSGLFPSAFPTKTLYALSSPHKCYMSRSSHSRFDDPTNIWWGVQNIKLLSMLFSPLSWYFVPLTWPINCPPSRDMCDEA